MLIVGITPAWSGFGEWEIVFGGAIFPIEISGILRVADEIDGQICDQNGRTVVELADGGFALVCRASAEENNHLTEMEMEE